MFLSSLLLCAGESRRMGAPKALLTLKGQSFLSRALGQLLNSRTSEVICVTGSDQVGIEREIFRTSRDPRIKLAHNPDHRDGILGSIQTGIRALDERSEGFLITLVDLPLLTTGDFDFLCESFRFNRPLLARYSYNGEPAHPAIFSRSLESEILERPASSQGLAFLFEKYAAKVWWLPADSRQGLDDIDTREDYFAHLTP